MTNTLSGDRYEKLITVYNTVYEHYGQLNMFDMYKITVK